MNDPMKIVRDIVIAIVIVGMAVAGYWYYQKSQKNKDAGLRTIQEASRAADELSESASRGVLPSIDPGSNPLENAPDVNPISKTNPFADIKTNPFK